MSDSYVNNRLCIASNGTVQDELSTEDMLSCCLIQVLQGVSFNICNH